MLRQYKNCFAQHFKLCVASGEHGWKVLVHSVYTWSDRSSGTVDTPEEFFPCVYTDGIKVWDSTDTGPGKLPLAGDRLLEGTGPLQAVSTCLHSDAKTKPKIVCGIIFYQRMQDYRNL